MMGRAEKMLGTMFLVETNNCHQLGMDCVVIRDLQHTSAMATGQRAWCLDTGKRQFFSGEFLQKKLDSTPHSWL